MTARGHKYLQKAPVRSLKSVKKSIFFLYKRSSGVILLQFKEVISKVIRKTAKMPFAKSCKG